MLLLRVDGAPLDVQVVNSIAEGVHVDAALELRWPCDCNEGISAISVASSWHFTVVHLCMREATNGLTNVMLRRIERNVPDVDLASWSLYPLSSACLDPGLTGKVLLDR